MHLYFRFIALELVNLVDRPHPSVHLNAEGVDIIHSMCRPSFHHFCKWFLLQLFSEAQPVIGPILALMLVPAGIVQ